MYSQLTSQQLLDIITPDHLPFKGHAPPNHMVELHFHDEEEEEGKSVIFLIKKYLYFNI
jgi:hypothetical protein